MKRSLVSIETPRYRVRRYEHCHRSLVFVLLASYPIDSGLWSSDISARHATAHIEKYADSRWLCGSSTWSQWFDGNSTAFTVSSWSSLWDAFVLIDYVTCSSKTASRLDESRVRFDRLAFKLHAAALPQPPTAGLTDTPTNQNVSLTRSVCRSEFYLY